MILSCSSNFFVNVKKFIAYIASHVEVLRGSSRTLGAETRDELPTTSRREAVAYKEVLKLALC